MKRVYIARNGDASCLSTRLVDIVRFVKKILLTDCKDGFYRFEFEVKKLK